MLDLRFALPALGAVLGIVSGPAAGQAVADARAALFTVLEGYTPGTPPDAALSARIEAAAAALERAAGPPDLQAQPGRLAGLWRTLFSSQGVFGEVDLAFMTRALPGGGASGGTAVIRQVLQDLRPAEGLYRNMMVMEVGPEALPALYFATASMQVAAQPPNGLEVSFQRIEFVPARADVGLDALRRALQLPETTPLAIEIPPGVPASASLVSYLDDRLRINRGKDYIVVLERVQ